MKWRSGWWKPPLRISTRLLMLLFSTKSVVSVLKHMGFFFWKSIWFFCLQRQNTQRLWNTPSNDIDPKYHFSSGYRAASPSLIVCNFTLQNAWLIYDSIRFQNNKVTLQEVVCKKPLSMRVLMTRTKPHSTPEYGVGKNLIRSPIFFVLSRTH